MPGDKLKEVRSTEEVRRGSAAERAVLNRLTPVLKPVDRPASHGVRITFLGAIARENVPGVYPSVEAAREEVQWMAELREEILRQAARDAGTSP